MGRMSSLSYDFCRSRVLRLRTVDALHRASLVHCGCLRKCVHTESETESRACAVRSSLLLLLVLAGTKEYAHSVRKPIAAGFNLDHTWSLPLQRA